MTMVEKVARAINLAQEDWANNFCDERARGSLALQRAIYAIQAMREPDEAMTIFGGSRISKEPKQYVCCGEFPTDTCVCSSLACSTYKRMIDAALAKTEPPK